MEIVSFDPFMLYKAIDSYLVENFMNNHGTAVVLANVKPCELDINAKTLVYADSDFTPDVSINVTDTHIQAYDEFSAHALIYIYNYANKTIRNKVLVNIHKIVPIIAWNCLKLNIKDPVIKSYYNPTILRASVSINDKVCVYEVLGKGNHQCSNTYKILDSLVEVIHYHKDIIKRS